MNRHWRMQLGGFHCFQVKCPTWLGLQFPAKPCATGESPLMLGMPLCFPAGVWKGRSSHEDLSYFRVSAEAPSSEICLPCLEASPLLHLMGQEGVLASSGKSRPFRCLSPARGGEQISSNPASASMHSEILQMLFALQCILNGPAVLEAKGAFFPS